MTWEPLHTNIAEYFTKTRVRDDGHIMLSTYYAVTTKLKRSLLLALTENCTRLAGVK